MAPSQEAVKHLDPLNVYAVAYKATWTERGVTAHGYLEPIKDDTRRGYLLDVLSSRASGPGRLGSRQAVVGEELEEKLREWLLVELRAAGWNVSGQVDGKAIWKHVGEWSRETSEPPPTPISVSAQKTTRRVPDLPAKPRVTPVGVRIASPPQQKMILRSTRPITFVCQWCGQEVTEQRYPSHLPQYCSNSECKREANKVKTRVRVALHRKLHPDARKKPKEVTISEKSLPS